MADHANDGDNNDVFVYMGGVVPQHLREIITHVRVHKSVKIIPARSFYDCENLVSIEFHDGVEIIEHWAFSSCTLREIKLLGVRVIGEGAFSNCVELADVEFGNKLETIEHRAFVDTALRRVKIPKVRVIESCAFGGCEQLMEAKLSEDLETIGYESFTDCFIRRITLPLKPNLLGDRVFHDCDGLSTVDLVWGIHKTISSLLLDSWRNQMKDEIDRINQDLPNTDTNEKPAAIQLWMERVIRRVEHYKSEHYALLKEITTLLELALWKAKLDESQYGRSIGSNQPEKKAKIDEKAARQKQRITSGANIVIKNVLPFLKLE